METDQPTTDSSTSLLARGQGSLISKVLKEKNILSYCGRDKLLQI
jgi:hypothetical protein